MSAAAPAKKVAKSKEKVKPAHPPTSVMVLAAVKALKERNGSSLPAIKKYISANYKVDIAKLSPFIKKALKSLTEKKKLVQTKGTGASGSFKLAAAAKVEKPKKKAVKPTKAKSPKKKAAKPKKAADEKKVAKPKKAKSPKKVAAKKAAAPKKSPAKKPAAKKPVAKKPVKKTTNKKKATPKKK